MTPLRVDSFTGQACLDLANAQRNRAALLGRELAELTAAGVVALRRVVSSLTEVARADAYAVWGICAAMLPALLRLAAPPPGTADLLALAATAATGTGTRAHLPEVAEVAGRRGNSRLVTEAKRLTRVQA